MMRMIKKIVGSLIRIGYRCIYRIIPVDPNMVLFISFHGRGYSDNPRAIYEAMRQDERFRDHTFLWAIKQHKKKGITIEGARVIEYLSLPYFFYLSRAKYWIFNCKMPDYIRKKDEQIYLQTWHGTPLKRLAHDIHVAEDTTFYRSRMSAEEMYRSYDVDVARYNYMISPNRFCTEVFQSAFQIDRDRLIETGYPRNDRLVNATAEDAAQIRRQLGIPQDKKVVLYAPTWRDDQYVAKGYTFHLEADFRKWKRLLGEDHVVVFKPHYLIINEQADDPQLEGFLYSIGADQDISSLYLIADVRVTDYSSVFYDYSVLKRPIYFYMYDIDSYREELRGFYIDIYKDLPGNIYEEEETMLKDIAAGIYDEARLEEFHAYFNEHEDGQASKRVIDIVFKE
mgnify:FL=1